MPLYSSHGSTGPGGNVRLRRCVGHFEHRLAAIFRRVHALRVHAVALGVQWIRSGRCRGHGDRVPVDAEREGTQPSNVGSQRIRESHFPVHLDGLVPDTGLTETRHQILVGRDAGVWNPKHYGVARIGRTLPKEGDGHVVSIAGNWLDQRRACLPDLLSKRIDALLVSSLDRRLQSLNPPALRHRLRWREPRCQGNHSFQRNGVSPGRVLVRGGNLHTIGARSFGERPRQAPPAKIRARLRSDV